MKTHIVKDTPKLVVKLYEIPNFEIDRIDFALCKDPYETLPQFYKRQIIKPNVLINGGFFVTSKGNTIFNYIDEGKVINEDPKHRWGMGLSIDNERLIYGHMERANYKDFISGYPNLIDNYTACPIDFAKEIDYKATRTILGYDDNSVFIMIVEGEGLRFIDCQDILTDYGVRYAINLDGGGSSGLLLNGELDAGNWSRRIDNVVCFYLNNKSIDEPILYRVQVGAFSKKLNADTLLESLKTLGFSDAYVRLINGLYKVQVGAFSVKGNADKLAEKLKSYGHATYITTESGK